ncbi:MAG: amidohydrolase family protein [Thermoguttaceae bacterium]|jgi:N-acetylglucosamine-6-phosphate deacetylase|nr:amidohydrolase family protein [Thermoguttaceae bacterium]
MELYGRRFDTGEPVRVEIRDGEIARVASADTGQVGQDWPWLAPGLVDIQVNGYGGQEFSSGSLTVERAAAAIRAFDRYGVTRLCPTVTTESFEVLRHALSTLAALCATQPEIARRVPGFHLEGPYITREDGARGAHPKQHCRPPDWDEFRRLQDAAEGRIRIVTLSPEYDASLDFIRRAAESGLVVAIGHMTAAPERVRAAVDVGARLSTHLGNGSHPMLHRLRNYLWAQLADDRLAASLIVDGHHLPPEVVKVFVRTKTPSRCILVSDLSGQAGQAPGRYTSPFCDVEILPDGNLVVAGQREIMAGASRPLNVGVANVMRYAGVDLWTAVRMATDNPAALVGIPPGQLEPGAPADVIQFHLREPGPEGQPARLDVQRTILGGQVVWEQSSQGL